MAKGKKKELTPEERLQEALVPIEEQPYQIPDNWKWIFIEGISEIVSKGTTPKGGKDAYVEQGIPFLRVENLNDDGTISHESIKYVTLEQHENFLSRSQLKKNDVLVSIAGTLGKTAIVDEDSIPMNTNQAIAFIRVVEKLINPAYLRLVIESPVIHEILLSKTKVTSIPNLTLEIIRSCPVPYPPLAEQQRIVERIESLFAKLDEAKEKAQQALESFELRKKALLYNAFTGQYSKEEFSLWKKTRIEELGEVKGGKRLPKGETLVSENTGFPYIRAGDLKNGTVLLENLQYLRPETQKQIVRYTVSTGDVYITIVGACIGDVGVIPEAVNGANLTENAAKITNLKCSSQYLGYYMASDLVQDQIKSRIASATLGKLSLQNIKQIQIAIPSIETQKEIVDLLSNVLDREAKIVNSIESTLDEIDLMKKSILAKAFRGELGTNDPQEHGFTI